MLLACRSACLFILSCQRGGFVHFLSCQLKIKGDMQKCVVNDDREEQIGFGMCGGSGE